MEVKIIKEIYIDKEDVKARIHEWGSSENPTIICIHGLGSTSLSFIELAHLLKNQYHILSIDLPGHGKTPEFFKVEDYEAPNMIKWVDKVISHLTKGRFYLLAHSWGANIALHYLSKYPSKVINTMLLDGGYYLKTEWYSYQTSISGEIDSLQSEIDYYIKDFDEYCFDTLQEHIEVEKNNYIRWSCLLEEAARDLVRVEDDKYKWHANSFTATGAIKSMYYYPPDSIYDKLPSSIYLLQSTLPESMNKYRETLAEKFKNSTGSKVKRIDGASHLLHWDKPNEVVKEILNWFK
ncbi:alpha/beta hydrolase [Senegalia massiliensis]|uniref:Alpha/beta hydrolase n=1 Tax=Senegalia massiliensis TaxID=1720316 RepID=A0A845QWR1_9CLOT|nr:alpha/beta hydrolase [Senegalia massiliensis]NBI05592.1 alpha/beta hydrolase [Senegalia massiliensis]